MPNSQDRCPSVDIDSGLEKGGATDRLQHQKKAPALQGLGWLGSDRSLADLRGIAEGDGEEQGGNGQGQNQDVGEALHGEFSVGEGKDR